MTASQDISDRKPNCRTFTFSLLRTPTQQRRDLLLASEFAPIPLHRALRKQIDKANDINDRLLHQITGKWRLFGIAVIELRSLVLEMVTLSILSSFAVLASVLVVQRVFGADLNANKPVAIRAGLFLGALYLLFKALQAILEYLTTNRRLQIHRGVQLVLYRLINEKLARIAPAGRTRFSSGQLKTLIGSDVEAIEDFISAALMQWTPALVSTLVITPALWFVSGLAGLVGLLSALAVIPVAAFGAVFIERLQVRAQAQQDKLITRVGEWVKNIRLVRFLGWERAIEGDINDRMWSFVWRSALRHGISVCVWALTYSWSMVPLITISAVSIYTGRGFNLVNIFASLWLLEYLMFQIQNIPHSLSLYGSACAGATRVIDLLKQPDISDHFIIDDKEITISHPCEPNRLILSDLRVSFGDINALNGISLTLDLNQRTAIVGSVASGKSTLLECLIGELPPTAGSITVEFSDGAMGDLWKPEVYTAFRRKLAYSPQQPFLSNASMRDNIDLSGEASLEDISAAIGLAHLSEDLLIFPRGINEEVGESGINLSGGQRQRVSLARAFISKRPLLVLDDPLSAVDHRTERALMESIVSNSQGIILVSHRLIELQRCHRVIVMERGVVVEDGDPKLLAEMHDSRFFAFLQATSLHSEELNHG